MLKKIVLHRFKQFKDSEIQLRPGVSFIVGGNNSGKSSILHALAVWEFCRTILEMEKGRKAFLNNTSIQGVGIGDDEFSPINVPSLQHLWTNLKTQKDLEPDGYTLKIRAFWDDESGNELFLEFALALANDRLFVKTTASNLIDTGTHIPKLAYLPPFAGITDRETRLTPAMRNRLIGQGLSGGVIRNVIHDMYEINQEKRTRLRGNRTKIKTSDLERLRESDPWELLAGVLREVFQCGLVVSPFNEQYHTYIRIETYKGAVQGVRFQKHPGYTPRDLMVEGSGFLQWLSVYALALTPEVNVIVLDEPDAHLHCSLQLDLIARLQYLAARTGKQVVVATHSTEIIKACQPGKLLHVSGQKTRYLSEDSQKIGLLAGIGTDYSPRLHKLQAKKRVLFVENELDERLLRVWGNTIGMDLPDNLLVWLWPCRHKERKQLFVQLKTEIPQLLGISMCDRDDDPNGTAGADLIDKRETSNPDGFSALKWRRRHIENYLIHPEAIGRAAGVNSVAVREYLAAVHGLAIPANVTRSDVLLAVRDAHGKEIMLQGDNCLTSHFGISREDIAREMAAGEVPEDVKTLLGRLKGLCKD